MKKLLFSFFLILLPTFIFSKTFNDGHQATKLNSSKTNEIFSKGKIIDEYKIRYEDSHFAVYSIVYKGVFYSCNVWHVVSYGVHKGPWVGCFELER